MITLVTGSGGSGKSYYCVTEILKTLDSGRKVYTNIKMYLEHDNFVYLNEKNMKLLIQDISDRFDNVDDFPALVDQLKSKEWFGSRLFLDEIHLLGFRKKLDGLINFLSVQRHLDLDVFLITQTLAKIDRVYQPDVHNHIAMVPANSRVNKNLIGWKVYDSIGGDKISTKWIQPKTEIFSLYKTGKNDSASNPMAKKLVLSILGLLAAIGISLYMFTSATNFSSNIVNSNLDNNNSIDNNNSNLIDINATTTISYGVSCFYSTTKIKDFIWFEKKDNYYYYCTTLKHS